VAAEVMVIRALAPGPSVHRGAAVVDQPIVVLAGSKRGFVRSSWSCRRPNVRMIPIIADLVQGDIASVISQELSLITSVVREGLVGSAILGHVLTTLHCSTDTVTRVMISLASRSPWSFAALLREIRQPADSSFFVVRDEDEPPSAPGYVVPPTAAALDFQTRVERSRGALQGRRRGGAGLLLDCSKAV